MENNNIKNIFSMKISAFAGAVFIFMIMALPVSANTNPGVVPVDGTSKDKRTYNELGGDWWNWVSQYRFDESPNNENGGVNCSRGQSGKVWFLAGTFGVEESYERYCTIPTQKNLFFPIFNSLWWTPEDGATVEEVRALANADINMTDTLEVMVDGVEVKDIFAYRAQSPAGGFVWKGELQIDFTGSEFPRPSATDGYWILLKPLSKGEHTIHFTGGIAGVFEVDITYHITVNNKDDD